MSDKETFEYWFDHVRPSLLPDYKLRVYNDYIEFAKYYHQVKKCDLADVVLESGQPYCCYMETQSNEGRCDEHCGNDNYCPRKAVCDNWKSGEINHSICENCGHAKPIHEAH